MVGFKLVNWLLWLDKQGYILIQIFGPVPGVSLALGPAATEVHTRLHGQGSIPRTYILQIRGEQARAPKPLPPTAAVQPHRAATSKPQIPNPKPSTLKP